MDSFRAQWRACCSNPADPQAWQDFLGCVHARIAQIATRTAAKGGMRDAADVEDIFQEICLKLSRHTALPAYALESDSAAEAYLTVVAVNAARDIIRSRLAAKRGRNVTQPLDDHAHRLAIELGEQKIERDLLFREIADILGGSDRDRSIFWLYYKQGFSAREIAAIPAIDLSPKGVESVVARLTDDLRVKLAAGRQLRPVPSTKSLAVESPAPTEGGE